MTKVQQAVVSMTREILCSCFQPRLVGKITGCVAHNVNLELCPSVLAYVHLTFEVEMLTPLGICKMN